RHLVGVSRARHHAVRLELTQLQRKRLGGDAMKRGLKVGEPPRPALEFKQNGRFPASQDDIQRRAHRTPFLQRIRLLSKLIEPSHATKDAAIRLGSYRDVADNA